MLVTVRLALYLREVRVDLRERGDGLAVEVEQPVFTVWVTVGMRRLLVEHRFARAACRRAPSRRRRAAPYRFESASSRGARGAGRVALWEKRASN